MIPHELIPRKIKLPETDNHSIVLITGSALRHQRFAYRIQKEFGNSVLAWYQFKAESDLMQTESIREKISILYKKIKKRLFFNYKIEDIGYYIKDKGLVKGIKKGFLLSRILTCTVISNVYLLKRRQKRLAYYEKKLFQQEIEDLKKYAKLTPVLVEDPNSKEFIECIKKLNPYFFLSLGGPLYKKELLESIRGIAINQHAGWSPTFKGSNTIDWALYHREFNYVGSTVHIATTAADAGPILRRSHPCLISTDTPESSFARAVALGTELIIEIVNEIIVNKEIFIYDQPRDIGMTYLNSQLDKNILKAIYKDFSKNWLQKELSRLRSF